MKRMLINATQPEECRLAIVEGQKLLDYEVEIEGREQRKGNIYRAIVTRVEQSLEACFVDYGEERHGFLPFKEISREYFAEGVSVSQARIQDAIREGQELVVQVEKEERGNKGAALTTFVSLAGRYMVLMPNNPRGGGVSRRIDGANRAELKSAMDKLVYPKGMSVIARTAGTNKSARELQWDLDFLLKLWDAIDNAASDGKGPELIYQESNLVIRAIRDYFSEDIKEILIDKDDIYEPAFQFLNHVMPDYASRVKRYRDNAPLFSRFQIEHQIETAYARTVQLPSGGAIVIDHTEALVSIDVNSARAIKGGDIEETATRTNLEAAEEVARQARLRDLGGLIVIDFIDMEDSKNRREVERRLSDSMEPDRARVQFGSISKFGLMELSRQRLKPALAEGASIPCPRCGGSGHVRDTESSALQILRIIQEEAMKDSTAAVYVQVPVEVASFLLNEKRAEIAKIEFNQRINVLLIPNKTIETPHYKLERLKFDDPRLDRIEPSYKHVDEFEDPTSITRRSSTPKNRQTPRIKNILHDGPAPEMQHREPEQVQAPVAAPVQGPAVAPPPAPAPLAPPPSDVPNWLSRLWMMLRGMFGNEPAPAALAPNPVPAPQPAPAPETPRTVADAPGPDARRTDRNRRDGRGERSRDDRGNRDGRGTRDGRREVRRDEVDDQDNGEQRQDRSERQDRGGERQDRSERQDRGGERQDRSERQDRGGERQDRNERQDRGGERQDRSERQDRGGERQDRNERQDRGGERQDRSERQDRGGERQDRNERQDRGGERQDRNERQDRGGERQDRRQSAERDGQADRSDADRGVSEARSDERRNGNGRDRDTRGSDTRERDSAPARDDERVDDSANGNRVDGEGRDGNRERRSRDRYGRDRRERGEREPAREDDAATAAPARAESIGTEPVSAESAPRSYFQRAQSDANAAPREVAAEQPAAQAVSSTPVASAPVVQAPAHAAPVRAAEPVRHAEPVRAVEPVRVAKPVPTVAEPTGRMPTIGSYTLPMSDLAQVAQASDLQWVNSNAERVAEVNAAIAAEPQPAHVPRERRELPPLDALPPVLVETKRQLVSPLAE